MAPLKVMGCPDRLASPSAAAFGKETFPSLALPLGCTRAFLPEGWSDPSVSTARPGVPEPCRAYSCVLQSHIEAQHQKIQREVDDHK